MNGTYVCSSLCTWLLNSTCAPTCTCTNGALQFGIRLGMCLCITYIMYYRDHTYSHFSVYDIVFCYLQLHTGSSFWTGFLAWRCFCVMSLCTLICTCTVFTKYVVRAVLSTVVVYCISFIKQNLQSDPWLETFGLSTTHSDQVQIQSFVRTYILSHRQKFSDASHGSLRHSLLSESDLLVLWHLSSLSMQMAQS